MVDERQPGLRELLEIAHSALEAGRHQEATVACRHVLRDYPDAITAMRLLGESYLEAGRPDEATRAFERVLASDPANVLARVGLGVLAEDRGDDERAITQFRLAWEVGPAFPQLRSELVRLYRKRYGVGGRLRMTRVSLANLHARNEDLPRAIRQFQLLHREEPARLDIAIGLAETFWRHGDDVEAQALCRALLATRPLLARPLLILAASLGDQPQTGDAAAEADSFLPRARALDPDAALAAELAALRPSHTLQRFVDAPVAMTPFDPATLTVAGTDELLGERTSTLGADSFRWEDVAGGLAGEGILSKNLAQPGSGGLQANDEVDALFAAIDRQLATTGTPDALDPNVVADLPEPVALTAPLAAWDDAPDDGMEPTADEPSAVERLTANWDNIDNELAAARPSDDLPTGMTGMLSALEEEFTPFDVDTDAEPDEEQVISFDPSKFSLPPLDGEEDEEIGPEFNTGALGVEIAPFDLDAASPRIKTGGLTFAELVRQGRQTPAIPDAAAADPDAAHADITSIFVTRDLSSVSNEDWLIDMQAAVEGLSPAAAAGESLAVEPQPGATLALSDDDLVDPYVRPAETPARRFETLFGNERPQVELPEAAFDPGLTRPLLDRGSSYAPGMPLAQQQPDAGDTGEDMSDLFTRLRRGEPAASPAHMTTDQLEKQGMQAFESVEEPLSTHSTDETLGDTAADGAMLDAWVRGDSTSFDPASGPISDDLSPLATDAANLDDWLMSFSDDDLGGSMSSDTDDEDGALLGDDWLSSIAEPTLPPMEPPTAATGGESFANLLDTPRPGVPPTRDEPAPRWSAPAPEEAAPRWETPPPTPLPERARAAEPVPAPWNDDLPLVASANGYQPARGGTQTYATNGHRPSVTPPAPTPAPAPPRREEPTRAHVAAQDRNDQIAILESLVAAEPGNHFARLTLAVAYGDGQPDRALNEYRRLVKDSEELVPEVIERLKEMIADGDAPPRTHRVLGDAYMKQGQFDLAMAEFQRALTNRLR
jgi:tetratricopeptide (TPR) repeat protein